MGEQLREEFTAAALTDGKSMLLIYSDESSPVPQDSGNHQ